MGRFAWAGSYSLTALPCSSLSLSCLPALHFVRTVPPSTFKHVVAGMMEPVVFDGLKSYLAHKCGRPGVSIRRLRACHKKTRNNCFSRQNSEKKVVTGLSTGHCRMRTVEGSGR